MAIIDLIDIKIIYFITFFTFSADTALRDIHITRNRDGKRDGQAYVSFSDQTLQKSGLKKTER